MPTPGDKRTAANPNPTQSGSFVYTNRLKTALLHWEAAYCADGYNHFTILELLRTDGGRAGFSVLLFQDIAVIPILALLPLLALPGLGTNDATEGSYAHAMTLVEGVTGWSYAGVVVAAVALVVLGGHFLSRPLFRFIAAARLREIFTATALLLVIGIALLMSLIDLSPALGTFLAGVVLANSEFRHELESDIEPFKGLLLGLFFITVGAGIDFGILADDFATVAGLTLGLMLGKGMVQYGLARLFRLTSTLRFPGERMIIHTASSIQVNLPLEEVFQYIAVDFFENYRKWSPEVTHLVKTCDAEMGIGVTGHQVRYDAGHRSEADFRVTHFLPLRELRCSSLTRPRFTVRYRFQAVAGGSRILFDFELEPELLMLPFRRLIDDAIRRGARRMLGNLKAALESDAAHAQYATPITAPGDGASVPRHQDLGDRGHD